MKKHLFIITLFIFSCDTGNLPYVVKLPKKLVEVSGMEYHPKTTDFWMLNDGGNPNEIYRVSKKGNVKQTLKIDAKNYDWEDLTKDEKGNYYIGDFGNNNNNRKNLRILVVKKAQFDGKKAAVQEINFSYPNQKQFPPENSNLIFDAEALVYFNNYLYIFTKSRIEDHFGKTNLYKVPAKKGTYIAELVSSYENCTENSCWITSAAISPNKEKIVLLSQQNLLIFSGFKNDDFFSGNVKTIPFTAYSQKESVCFKNNTTVYISDEYARGKGGKVYELVID